MVISKLYSWQSRKKIYIRRRLFVPQQIVNEAANFNLLRNSQLILSLLTCKDMLFTGPSSQETVENYKCFTWLPVKQSNEHQAPKRLVIQNFLGICVVATSPIKAKHS